MKPKFGMFPKGSNLSAFDSVEENSTKRCSRQVSKVQRYNSILPSLAGFDFNQIRQDCLPPAGAFHAPARQARPDLPGVVFVDDPLPDAFRLWATDRVIVHWTIS